MTPLRQSILDDMRIRNFSPLTQKAYIRPKEIRDYPVFLVDEAKISYGTLSQIVSALRFLCKNTLKQRWNIEEIPSPRREKRLPCVPCREEIEAFQFHHSFFPSGSKST